ncbi:MAG: hypothetical protein JWN75_996 [Candidatus Saccharibacteria bacterium]|nr:hypothetical protein [Candidatus Saccharibacteria bacterium]
MPTAGLRKRQQISQANKMMFLWIAGISVIVGISVVLTVFLVQKIWFGEKVIYEKNKTVSILDQNLSKVNTLRDNIRVLNTNKDLATTKLNESDPPLQSVLDALPAAANSTALASSLQTKLLSGVPGIVVETINVEPVSGLETSPTSNSSSSSSTSTGDNQINFTFAVSTDQASYGSLRQVLDRLEKSIRPFNITNLVIESQGKRVIMTAKGTSYYDSAKTIQLTQKVVKP